MKRSNGEGTIYKRSDGRWCAAFYDEEGTRHFVYGKTQTEVKKKLKAKMENPKANSKKESESYTLEEWMSYFLMTYKKNELKESTYAQYLALVKKHIKDSKIGKTKLENLSGNMLQEFYNEKRDKGYNAKTIKHMFVLINSALNKAVQLKMLKENMNQNVVIPKREIFKTNVLSAEEVKKILTDAKEDKLYPIVVFAIFSGLRKGEIMGLKYDNINYDEAEVHVEGSLCRVMLGTSPEGKTIYGYKILSPKTVKSKRTVPLLPIAIEALKLQQKSQEEDKLKYADIYNDQGIVFARYNGDFIEQRSFLNEYHDFLRRYGIRDIRFHDLRHTFATLLLEAGESPKVIQELLGHSTITTTMDIYAHVTKKGKVSAMESLNSLIKE